jgi:hypothetical protein
MPIETTTQSTDDVWNGGFVCGLLTARYYVLRHAMTDDFFRSAAPTDMPEVVCALVSNMCRASIDQRLFQKSWAALDHLLLCDSADELVRALSLVHDHKLQ